MTEQTELRPLKRSIPPDLQERVEDIQIKVSRTTVIGPPDDLDDRKRRWLITHMAHFTAFDDSCDSSALLGIIINIDRFPKDVQHDAGQIRYTIRNPWAHCDFSEWDAVKCADSFQLMGQLVQHLCLSNREEHRILGELNKWATNGQNFLSGTLLGLEIVDEMRQQTHVLSEYVQTLCTEADSQFIKVQKELREFENGLMEVLERIRNLENVGEKSIRYIKQIVRFLSIRE
ncbi:Hypothetical predicted protein [Mytilus galloprovincialis]|uniref:Uncharacterized protein n=1 Tax=Mytilus galloprovincialis TaxID=29158 RepID=A0A8B6ECB9_MYTGA|nr:Hypothetical predicted protein [Mytilus galloprovincialis]